jgi:hypothetical protein
MASFLLGGLVTMGGFGMPSRQAENGFIPDRLCFVEGVGTKQWLRARWPEPDCNAAGPHCEAEKARELARFDAIRPVIQPAPR